METRWENLKTRGKEHINKLSDCLLASKSKVIEYVNCLIKRRIMSFSEISSITLKCFNSKKQFYTGSLLEKGLRCDIWKPGKHSQVEKLSKWRGFISCYNGTINWHLHQCTLTLLCWGTTALLCVLPLCHITIIHSHNQYI